MYNRYDGWERLKKEHPDLVRCYKTNCPFFQESSIDIKPPIQIELHLFDRRRCTRNCIYCCGRFVQKPAHTMSTEGVIKLISSMKREKVTKLVLSGIYSDPLLHPDIFHIISFAKNQGLRIGIHTSLSNIENNRLIELLVDSTTSDDYINIHVDTLNPDVHRNLNHPKWAKELQRTIMNTEKFCHFAGQKKAELEITLICQLLRANSTFDQLDSLLAWYRGLNNITKVNLRFSTPSLPPLCPSNQVDFFKRQIFLSNQKRQSIFNYLEKKSQEVALLTRGNIYLLPLQVITSESRFCWSQLIYGYVAADGFIYPCQAIGSPSFAQLRMGSIYQSDFFDIWYTRNWEQLTVDLSECPHCAARTEAQVNNGFAKEVEHEWFRIEK